MLPANRYPNARVEASSAQLDWPGLLAERLEHPAGRIRPTETDATELTMVLEGRGSVSRKLNDSLPQAMEVVPGAMWLTPAGSCNDFIEFDRAIPQVLHLYLTPDRFGAVCPHGRNRMPAISSLRRDAPFRDPLIEELARAVSAELNEALSCELSIIVPLGLCLAARLLQAHSDALLGPDPPRHASGLGPLRLAKVREHVAAALDQDLSVSQLAKIACLSPSHFAHAFSTSVGDSPEHYVSVERVRRAMALLQDGTLPLDTIAAMCGFSSQASFTRAFVRETGRSPGRYRQQFRDLDGSGKC